MTLSPATKEFFHNVWFFIKTNFMLTTIGMLLAGLLCLAFPPLIPGVGFAGLAASAGASMTVFLLTIPLQEVAVILGIVAGGGVMAGITALATAASAPFLIPFFACLGIALPIATFISGLAMMAHAKMRKEQAAAAQALEPNDDQYLDEVLQPAPASSSAQVSQALNIQVGLNAGNDEKVAVTIAPQEFASEADEEKDHPVEHVHSFSFPIMS